MSRQDFSIGRKLIGLDVSCVRSPLYSFCIQILPYLPLQYFTNLAIAARKIDGCPCLIFRFSHREPTGVYQTHVN